MAKIHQPSLTFIGQFVLVFVSLKGHLYRCKFGGPRPPPRLHPCTSMFMVNIKDAPNYVLSPESPEPFEGDVLVCEYDVAVSV